MFTKLCSPGCRQDCKGCICYHCCCSNGSKLGSILVGLSQTSISSVFQIKSHTFPPCMLMDQSRTYQNTTNERNFQGCRNDMKHHGRQQEADTLCTTINRPCETTRLSSKVEVQIQSKQVLEYISSDTSNGLLCHASKNGISCFCKERCTYTCCSI